MILSDTDILKRLPELDIKAANPNFIFDPGRQVQPCSIDLRLDTTIWKPTLRASLIGSIDLSNQSPLGPQITKAFRQQKIAFPRGFLLKPGQFVLGRTYESFSMPPDLMGRLAGRSSLGRLGLSVVAPSSLINPGWKGHMPLMLINHSPFNIRLHPFLGIVQLCLFSMSSKAKKVYGPGAGSKYREVDDGGPSRYWLDHTIGTLRENLNLRKTSDEVAILLEAYSQELDETTRKRLSKKIEKTETIPEFDEFVKSFVDSERRRPVLILLLPILVGALLGVLTGSALGYWTSGFIVGVCVVLAIAVGWTQWGTTMTPEDLRKLQRQVRERR